MRAIDVLYYFGFIIAFSSTSSVIVFYWVLFHTIDFKLIIIVFTLTVGSYTIDRLAGAEKDRTDHPKRSRCFIKYRNLSSSFSVIILALAISLAFWRSLFFGLLALIAPIVVLLYSYESRNAKVSVKMIPYAKGFIIAGGWSALILVVLVYNELAITTVAILFSVGIFGKFYVMAVLYDFKDIASDLKNGIRTLPNTIGEQSTKSLLNVINILSTLWIIGLVYYGIISHVGYIFIPACLFQTLLIGLVSKTASKWVYYILCDLEQVTWLFFAIILVMIWV